MSDLIRFSDLVARHGEIEAMRQLEAIEAVAVIQHQLLMLRQEPEERLDQAMRKLVA